jgi:hypothetical protein
LRVLEDKQLAHKLRVGARRYAERYLAMDDYLTAFTRKIETLTGKSPGAPRKQRGRAVARDTKLLV